MHIVYIKIHDDIFIQVFFKFILMLFYIIIYIIYHFTLSLSL